MKKRPFFAAACLTAAILQSGSAQTPDPNSPAEHLPSHIKRLTYFGERADFSPDGQRVVFLSKTFGDAMEVNLQTGIIRNLTAHYPHYGYTRALYLSNGDLLLSGPVEFDPANPGRARDQCFLFVLEAGKKAPPHPLGIKCSEGPAVSRTRLHIAWTSLSRQLPETLPEGASQIQEADIVYENGTPKLANIRLVLDSRTLPFECSLESQNFRLPAETELIFAAYGYQGTEVCGVDLASGKVTNYSNAPGVYAEPEGIYPTGTHTLVESDLHHPEGWHFADIYKLALDGSGKMERLTYFADVPSYRSSNPVISDDGRLMAFQMGRHGAEAGVGYGIFLYDFAKAGAAGGQ